MKIEQLNLNGMIENKLKMCGKIYFIDEVLSYEEDELLTFLSKEELDILKNKLKENGLHLHMVKSISRLNLSDDIISFLRNSYIHTIDELLLAKDIDLEEYKEEIDTVLTSNNLTRVCNSDDKQDALNAIKIRSMFLKCSIYEFRLMNSREKPLLHGFPVLEDSVRAFGGKYEMLEAMGYSTIGDLTHLNKREFMDLTRLLNEDDLLDKIHYFGFSCDWEIQNVYDHSDEVKFKQLLMCK